MLLILFITLPTCGCKCKQNEIREKSHANVLLSYSCLLPKVYINKTSFILNGADYPIRYNRVNEVIPQDSDTSTVREKQEKKSKLQKVIDSDKLL